MTCYFYLFSLGTLLIFLLRNSCPPSHLFWTLASQLAETFILISSCSLLFLQPVLNCAKLIALFYDFKALGDLTKKEHKTTHPLAWKCVSRVWGLEWSLKFMLFCSLQKGRPQAEQSAKQRLQTVSVCSQWTGSLRHSDTLSSLPWRKSWSQGREVVGKNCLHLQPHEVRGCKWS